MSDPTATDGVHPLVVPVIPAPGADGDDDPTGTDAVHPLTTPVVTTASTDA